MPMGFELESHWTRDSGVPSVRLGKSARRVFLDAGDAKGWIGSFDDKNGMNLVERGPIGTFVANCGRAAYFLGGADGGG